MDRGVGVSGIYSQPSALGGSLAQQSTGEVCTLDPRSLYRGLTLQPASDSADAITLPSPFVAPRPETPPEEAWAPEGFVDLFYPRQAGVYRLGEGGELLIVDALAGSESDVQASGSAGNVSGNEARQQGWPLYRWLLLTALLILLIETWLAGRGADGFLQRSSLSGDNPLAIRHRLVLGLRVLTVLLTFLALLDVPWLLPNREQRLIMVVDDTELYGREAQGRIDEVLSRVARLATGPRKEGIVLLRNGGQVLADLGKPPLPLPNGSSMPEANLASALDLSAGLLGELDSGRIAVVASGAQTRGEVARVLPELVAQGTPVDVLPVGGVPAGEVLLESLSLPPQLYQGDSFRLQGVIYSSAQVSATVRMWRDGELGGKQIIELSPGRNRVETTLGEEEAGRYLYEYEVIAKSDAFNDNNHDDVVAEVLPKATVALITPQPSWGGVLADALMLQGILVEVRTPRSAPYTLEDLLGYDAVILANVPAIDLHSSQQELLETWVHEYGGGLLVLGGENSFGPGGYYQTPLERVSPLSSRIPEEAPKVALLFVLDRSGSMQQRVGEVSRLEIAKQAPVEAIELLHEEGLAGVVVFDSEATTLLPLQPVGERAALAQVLEPLQPGGGTSIYPALVEAYEQMRLVDAAARHIVVMTDGLSQPGDFDTILDLITGDGITVSTVAIGQGADTALLQNISRRGGGTFHATTDFRALPSILSQEALMLSGTPIEEISFTPRWQNRDAAFLQGLPETLPPLLGHVRTSSKAEAILHLVGPEDDPILASWRYGLGRVVAFASQGAGEWTREWLSDPAYPLLWSQAVRWVLPPVAKPGLHLELERVGDEVRVQVQAVGEEGDPAEGLHLNATFAASGENPSHPLELAEIEAELYGGSFIAERPGQYLVQVKVASEVAPFTAVEREIFLGYPARYAFETRGIDRLQALAAATGGRVLFGDEPLFIGTPPIHWRWLYAWPLWAVSALILFVMELVLRYAPGFFSWRRRFMPEIPVGAALKGSQRSRS